MTVYVDDAAIKARVPYAGSEINGTWYHLIADTREELHAFARQLGLARSWFQEPKGLNGEAVIKNSLHAQMWHYDITTSKRRKAIQMGAKPVTSAQMSEIIRARHARQYPNAAKLLARRTQTNIERLRAAHDES
ncbi:MAG TPA: DUF4031 domain-containing protein [Nitrospira sp.]|nr:DUF4031 domain-containing protein [Nitrospira sp.]